MYRIEVAPSEEAVFRTIEELAVAIRNGVVTPRARIFHHASEKWLPIGLHPHYKKALEMPAANASPAPVTTATPVPAPSRPKTHPPSHSKPHSVVHYPEPKRSPEPESTLAAGAADAPKIAAPVLSPIIAMQNEVLRDLPVISIPEPLPWTVKASPAAAARVQPRAPVVSQAPVIQTPVKHPPVMQPPVMPPPVMHPPVMHPPVRRAPEPYRSLEAPPPVEERPDTDAGDPSISRPTARRSRRMGGRPFLLLGAAAALVVGTHFVLTATPSASENPAEAPAVVPEDEEPKVPSEAPDARSEAPAARSEPPARRAADAPRLTIAPARVPMTPGPAFAGSVPARPRADSAVNAPPTTSRATPAVPPATAPAIAPAPAAIELTLPNLRADSLVPAPRTGDTMGMRKVLRALNGDRPGGSPTP